MSLGIVNGILIGLIVARRFGGYWRGPTSFIELHRFHIAGGLGAVANTPVPEAAIHAIP